MKKNDIQKDNVKNIKTKTNDNYSVPFEVKYADGSFHIVYSGKELDRIGIENEDMFTLLINQIVCTISFNDETKANGAIAMFQSIGPEDDIERLLAVEMVAIHNMAMECSKRAMLLDIRSEMVNTNFNNATKLMRTFTAQMEALKRYRTGGKQTIQVQHVNVNDGGQAVVGNVQGGGGNG